jgi:hypothetical protein
LQAPIADGDGALPLSLAAADVNGDGAPDVVATHDFGNGILPPGKVDVFLNGRLPVDVVPPVVTVSASPSVLWPPNGRLVPVTISGTITDAASGVDASSATFRVLDEYGQAQPGGAVVLGAGGSYSFTVMLEASRRGDDRNGRLYTVTVTARDIAGNAGTANGFVTVPHDARH